MKLINRLGRFISYRKAFPSLPAFVLDVDRFQTIVEYERLRSDRTHSQFCVAKLYLELRQADEFAQQKLADCLKVRLRATDVIGMLDEQHLAALLPDTSEAGGTRVLDELVEMFQTDDRRLSYQLFIYPEQPPTDETTSPNNLHGRTSAAVDGDFKSAATDVSRFRAHADDRRSHGVRPLLVQTLPLWKRVFDIVIAAGALVLLSPLILCIALAIKATSRGPIVFRQRRSGAGGRPFTIFKFRTMLAEAEVMKSLLRPLSEQDGPAFKLKNDPRITRVGRILRKTCLDEVPQLWNVLRGEMSMVGPRPLPIDEQGKCQTWQQRRLDVVPGMTGSWQVSPRGVSFDDWMRMDVAYVNSMSLWQDLAILAKTFAKVIAFRASH